MKKKVPRVVLVAEEEEDDRRDWGLEGLELVLVRSERGFRFGSKAATPLAFFISIFLCETQITYSHLSYIHVSRCRWREISVAKPPSAHAVSVTYFHFEKSLPRSLLLTLHSLFNIFTLIYKLSFFYGSFLIYICIASIPLSFFISSQGKEQNIHAIVVNLKNVASEDINKLVETNDN